MPDSIFFDPNDENRLCQVLRAYVEEWGPDRVVISVPKKWAGIRSNGHLGNVQLRYETEQSVTIHVEQIDGSIPVCYTVDLQTA